MSPSSIVQTKLLNQELLQLYSCYRPCRDLAAHLLYHSGPGLTPQFHGIVLHTDLLTFLLTYFSKIMIFKNISPHGEIFLI